MPSSHESLAAVYEQRLAADPRWALSEGSRHFDEKSAVFDALHRSTSRLQELEIAYAVVGEMALFRHGLRRFTEDVAILVTKPDLQRIHAELEGRGYRPPHERSKHLRDTELGVRIEFLTTGEYPGDGRVKPVSFPDPRSVGIELDGVSYITLPCLVELKLASGMTNPGRMKDLADVLELIKVLNLPSEFSQQLHPYVQDKFRELWSQARTRYVKRRSATRDDELPAMLREGVVVENPETADALLVTTDAEVAARFGMLDESDVWLDAPGDVQDP